ncbi:lasso RiPP family leader peptide-containing protein [Spirosoma pollinicola]|nr:lasso RiPP family leader peptide-containing protein [Spirosoma pollinicola]
MKSRSTQRNTAPSPRKTYQTPALKNLGSVKKLTLKSGSATDGFGTFG